MNLNDDTLNIVKVLIEKLYKHNILTLKEKVRFKDAVKFTNVSIPLNTFQLEVISKFNFIFKYCYIEKSGLDEDLSLIEIKNIVDDAKILGVDKICITGGEPLLSNYIKQILQYIYENNIKCDLYTNAYLITDELCDFFKQIKLNNINLTIHDEFRNKKGSFDKNIELIKNLQALKILVTINSVLYKDNILRVNQLELLFKDTLKVKYKLDYIIQSGNAIKNSENINYGNIR